MTINLDDIHLTEILKKLIAEAEIKVHELYDDDEIADYIHESGMPIGSLYDDDEILQCECVEDAIAQEREDCEQETVEKYEEEIEELQKKVAELTEQMRFLDPNGKPCDRCNEPVCYEGNEGKISKKDDAIICAECDAREAQEAKYEAKYAMCSDCRRVCYTGGKVKEDWVCADCDEDEEASDADTE